jgi:UDP-glucose-4-epimerase GalE
MSILITGGAGYIGSHTAKLLDEAGLDVVILDNLSTGRRENSRWGAFIEGDIVDVSLVRSIIRKYAVTAVLHLAACAQAGDSVVRPDVYFANNVGGTLKLLDAMVAENVRQFVFASSSSVYGDTLSVSAHEDDPIIPMSAYGESKLQTERALPWYERAYGLRWAALRYFNVAGATDGLGEEISASLRIIPRTIHSIVGYGPTLEVFGTALPTLDGSAVRDYVHVVDVAQANLQALNAVKQNRAGTVLNIGSGTGVSVLQVIEAVSKEIGQSVIFQPRPPRSGDPAYTVSDISKARSFLGWTPVASSLTNIVASVVSSCKV